MGDPVHVFGIRHHGPGSSRSLREALAQLEPEILLVEGPPDADMILPLVSEEAMVPPVAALIYTPDEPKHAVFYPFAAFSPEWVAINFGLERNLPVRFMDLPQAFQLGSTEVEETGTPPDLDPVRRDPIGFLAGLAGYTDSERWWENLVEHRQSTSDIFAAILEAMSALRAESGDDPNRVEQQREAYMRQTIRRAKKDGYSRIAVVCGAWHAPALADIGPAKADIGLLEGMVKVKVAATWVPWTYSRLSYSSGYGAGIQSPGWYNHLWNHPNSVAVSWLTGVSQLLRQHDQETSPGHVIEAVRLAETLASLRDQALPGLQEMNEAVRSVFSFGSDLQLRLIQEQLIVGDRIGAVPSETPMLPLQRNIGSLQKSLRLLPDPTACLLDLDLRKDNDLQRSHFLHRTLLLEIPWGVIERAHGVRGTFHEIWKLQWRPEFSVAIIEAAVWGNTLADAAAARVTDTANRAGNIAELSQLLQTVLLADLPETVTILMERLQEQSAAIDDLAQIMDSLAPLATIARYGNVRKTDRSSVMRVIDGLIIRIFVGLPNACSNLDDEAAAAMFKRFLVVQQSLSLLQNQDYDAQWFDTLTRLIHNPSLHGLLAGKSCRILFDARQIERETVIVIMHRMLTTGDDLISAASWLEGFLKNSGQLLLLDDSLRNVLDDWVCGLSEEKFTMLIPLMRRTFIAFTPSERRDLGARLKNGRVGRLNLDGASVADVDQSRVQKTLPLIIKLLGLSGKQELPT